MLVQIYWLTYSYIFLLVVDCLFQFIDLLFFFEVCKTIEVFHYLLLCLNFNKGIRFTIASENGYIGQVLYGSFVFQDLLLLYVKSHYLYFFFFELGGKNTMISANLHFILIIGLLFINIFKKTKQSMKIEFNKKSKSKRCHHSYVKWLIH